jgi:hypothetical protein
LLAKSGSERILDTTEITTVLPFRGYFSLDGDPLGTAGSALLAVFVVDMADSSTTELADKEFCVVLRLVCGAVEQDNIAGRWRQL